MRRIAISTIVNIAHTDGTSVRARRMIELLGSKYEILLITRSASIDSRSIASSGKVTVRLVRPEGTKFYNLKLVPIILYNRFHAVYCVADAFGFITYYLLSRVFKYKIIFEAHAFAHREMEQLSKMRHILCLLLETFIGKKSDELLYYLPLLTLF